MKDDDQEDCPDYLLKDHSPSDDEGIWEDDDDGWKYIRPEFIEPECYSEKRLAKLYRKIPVDAATEDLLLRAFRAAAQLYGVISLKDFWPLFKEMFPDVVTENQFYAFTKVARHDMREEYDGAPIFYILGPEEFLGARQVSTLRDRYIVNGDYGNPDDDTFVVAMACQRDLDLDFARLPKEVFLKYADPRYVEPTPEGERLTALLKDDKLDMMPMSSKNEREEVVPEILVYLRRYVIFTEDTFKNDLYCEDFSFEENEEENKKVLFEAIQAFLDAIRRPALKGHKRDEVQEAVDKLEQDLKQDEERDALLSDDDLEDKPTFRCCRTLAQIYGAIPMQEAWKTIESAFPGLFTEESLTRFVQTLAPFRDTSFAAYECNGTLYLVDKDVFRYSTPSSKGVQTFLDRCAKDLPSLILTPEELLECASRPSEDNYLPWCANYDAERAVKDILRKLDIDEDGWKNFIIDLSWNIEHLSPDEDQDIVRQEILHSAAYLEVSIPHATVNALCTACANYLRHLRRPLLRGHTLAEVEALRAK